MKCIFMCKSKKLTKNLATVELENEGRITNGEFINHSSFGRFSLSLPMAENEELFVPGRKYNIEISIVEDFSE